MVFKIIIGMSQFGSYVERDFDRVQTESGDVDDKTFTWNPTAKTLTLQVIPMAITTYEAVPIRRQPFGQNQAGQVNKATFSLGDIKGYLSKKILADPSLLKKAKVIIRRTHPDLDTTDPNSCRLAFRGYITGVSADEGGNLHFEVSERYYDWSRSLNKRQFSKVCNFVFKRTKCGYVGAETVCDKTWTACDGYGNTDKFGGFPELPDLQFKRIS